MDKLNGRGNTTMKAIFMALALTMTARAATLIAVDGVTVTVTIGGVERQLETGKLIFDTYEGFCVEPNQELVIGMTIPYQQEMPIITPSASYNIARLLTIWSGLEKTSIQAAAMQLAIWEVVTDSGWETDGGSTFIGNQFEVGAVANGYLASLEGYTPANVTWYHNDDYQDIVVFNVPEPGVAMLGLIGLILLNIRRK